MSTNKKEIVKLPDEIIINGKKWELMDKNSMAIFNMELMSLSTGKGKDKKRLGELSIAANGSALYIFTEFVHPGTKDRKATYVLPLMSLVQDAMETIVSHGADFFKEGK